VEFLKTKGYTHYSSRELLVAEIKEHDLPVNRNQMRLMGNKLRKEHGDEFIAKRAYEMIEKNNEEDAVIESIRAVAEAEYIKANGGVLLAVDADTTVRYGRVQERRSESDKVDFKTFLAHEELEKNDPDPSGMQKARVMEMADYTLLNNGTITELEVKVEAFMERIKE
jgi:dephospho-CoA kinase